MFMFMLYVLEAMTGAEDAVSPDVDEEVALAEDSHPKDIWETVEIGNLEDFKVAMRHGGDVNKPNPISLDTPLIIATRSRNIYFLESLLALEVDVNAQNAHGDSALHWAAFHGDEKTVLSLLAKGAKKDGKGEYGNTPLHLACSANHCRIVQILLQEGASIVIKNDYGNDALSLSTSLEIQDMVKSVMIGGNHAREALRVRESEREARQKQEKEKEQERLKALELARRDQEERDQVRRDAIIAEEKRIEEEEEAREQEEAERLRKQEEERIAAEKAEAERLRKERKAMKQKGKKTK